MTIVFHAGYSSEPWGGTDALTSALGGTEKAICFLARELAKNHEVIVTGQVKNQLWCGVRFQTDVYTDRPIDFLIGVSYIHFLKYYEFISVKKTIFWLHNLDYFAWYKGEKIVDHRQLLYKVDQFVCVSKWHMEQMTTRFPEMIGKCTYVHNGINVDDFAEVKEKEPDSILYSSHPERGLRKVISELEPHQKLYVATPQYGVEYLREHFSDIHEMPNVEVLGALPQKPLYELMSRVETWNYPTDYDETFCITALEMMGHGVVANTSLRAALKEVVTEEFNIVTNVESQVEYVKGFDWSRIALKWHPLFKFSLVRSTSKKIERAYVISMNPEKIDEYKERLAFAGIDCPITIIKGVDARNFSEYDFKTYQGWDIDTDNNWWNQPVTIGEAGCGLAHLNAWRQVKKDGVNIGLILEEDFYFKETLDESLIPASTDWHIMYLGREKLREDQKDLGDVVVPGFSYNLHAYLISKEGADSLLQHNFQDYITTPDEFLPATYCEHPREDLRWITRDTKALALKKDIAFQTSNAETSRTRSTKNNQIFKSGQWSKYVSEWIHPAAKTKSWDMIFQEPIADVISFPLFTEEFCRLLIEEAEAKALWQTKRHQYYPTTDTLISSFGYDEIYRKVLKEYVFPAAIHRWRLDGRSWAEMTSENFMIKYTTDTQGHLDLHHDNAVISSVLTLNKEFTGGGTYFYSQNKTHIGQVGHITIHPGQVTHRHGGVPVHSGERYILVSFCNKPT